MKKLRAAVVMVALAVMIIGSTITTHAASIQRVTATHEGVYINGAYYDYPEEVETYYANWVANKSVTEQKYFAYRHSKPEWDYDIIGILLLDDSNEMMYSDSSFMFTFTVVKADTTTTNYSGTFLVTYKYYPETGLAEYNSYNTSTTVFAANKSEYGEEYNVTDAAHTEPFVRSEVFLNANTDVVYKKALEDGTTHFFQQLPWTLAPIMEKVGMEKVTAQVLSLVPICLACLVGYLALRKALAVLRAVLHQA